jgi:hypothetical protein
MTSTFAAEGSGDGKKLPKPETLLAVDCGLKLGLALFQAPDQLLWYRSQHLASPAKLKRFIYGLLCQQPSPSRILLEGGGELAELWRREAKKHDILFQQLQAHQWRKSLLFARQFSSGDVAKRNADPLARQVIERLGKKNPTSLRHDAAEAILIGLYGLLEYGWLQEWEWLPRGSSKTGRK